MHGEWKFVCGKSQGMDGNPGNYLLSDLKKNKLNIFTQKFCSLDAA